MTIDPYAMCPGGLGKKLKFCCHDLVADLDKLQRMVEGDQRVAALDYVTKLEAKQAGRACLLAVRSMLEMSLDKGADAAATIESYVEKFPANPIAWSRRAAERIRDGDAAGAIQAVLKSLETCDSPMPPDVYLTMSEVITGLLEMHYLIPARRLLRLQLQMSRGKDKDAAARYLQTESDRQFSLLSRLDGELVPAPDGAPWKFEFDVALNRAKDFQWTVAAEKLTALIPLAGQSPALWQNLVMLRGWLADDPGMVEALHAVAALDVPLDDAIEAEALAQIEGKIAPQDMVEIIELEYSIADQAVLEERFGADRQLIPLPIDPRDLEQGEDDDSNPPPRAIFTLLDRPLAATAVGLTHEHVSHRLGTVALFGRRTDRSERLALGVERSQLAAAEAQLRRIAGEALGPRTDDPEEIVEKNSLVNELLTVNIRLPADTAPDRRAALMEAERRDLILNRLPKVALGLLAGQTLEQAATDPRGRIQAAALLLLMELASGRQSDIDLGNELRAQIGLPIPAPIDPTQIPEDDQIPPPRLHRLLVEKLDDDRLLKIYHRAAISRSGRGIAVLAAEVVRRPQLGDRIDFELVHESLAGLTEDFEAAMLHVEQARSVAQKARRSSAQADIEELRTRARFGDLQGAARLFEHIAKEHCEEEGISEALARALISSGLIDSRGRLVFPRAEAASPILVPGNVAPGKILTPDNQPVGAERQPTIWQPGME